MNREYNCKVSSKNSKRLLKNLQNTTGDYFFLPHPVDDLAFMQCISQNPLHQRPRCKSTTSLQHKRHVRNKLAWAKFSCVVSFPKFHYNDLLRTCWPCR